MRGTAILAFVLALAVALPGHAQPRAAGDALLGGTFITPFPENDTYRVQVYGESMADGLLTGLAEVMGREARVVLPKRARQLTGLLRGEILEDLLAIEEELEREPAHVAIIMPNMILRFPWRENFDRRFPPGSEARREEVQRRQEVWKAERGLRLDQLIRALRRKNLAVYLVGLPIMRNPFTTDDAQVVNELLRERALVNGARFIDIYASFADEGGGFDPQGPDIDGKMRLLRDTEGIGFTAAGFRKLGHFVERELKRDLAAARAERNVPLAGSEEEQRRIRPAAVRPQPGPTGDMATLTKDGRPAPAVTKPSPPAGAWATRTESATTGEDIRADNGRVTIKSVTLQGREETVTIEIVRPPIPAALYAAVTRRESPDKPSQLGHSIVTEIAGGQTVISSVTPPADGGASDRRRGNTGIGSPYHLVLEKGQRLPPKPGRSDDMPWPRQEVLPYVPADSAGSDGAAEVRRPPAARNAPARPGGPRG